VKAAYTLILAGLVFSFAVTPAVSQARRPQSDVFLITIDTLRADHVHCYGDEQVQTPALDALAKDGVRFTEAFTPSPVTNTSHTSILTGLLPSSHGVTDFGVPLSPSHPTLAALLKDRGYHTAAFIGAVILDSKTLSPGLDQGFDFYDNFPEHSTGKSRWGRLERRGMDVVQHAETWLNAHRTGPRFVWVHLYDPHDPYEPPPPYSETYKDRLYDGEIAYADSALANLIAHLKAHQDYARSMIVVVGDHGEGLGEHHENTHGIFLYDSTLHVPLIVKLPESADAGKVVDAQVRTIDILPTVLQTANVPAPDKLDGKSLAPLFSGPENSARTAIGETDYPLRFGWAPLRSVRADGYKFIEAPRPELYDLHSDPGELQNRYAAGDDQAGKLHAVLAVIPTTQGAADAGSPGERKDLPDPKDKIEEQNLLHSAMMATEDNRPADARKDYEQVLQSDPKSPTALRQLGELELQSGDYAKAAQTLQKALEVRPQDATAAYLEGEALEKAHDLPGARDALELSLKLTPGQLEAHLLLGQIYLELRDPKNAEDHFEAAQLLQPDSMAAQIGSARAQIASGDFSDAVSQLKQVSQSEPENPEPLELLAEAYKGMGNTAAAEQAQSRAAQLRLKKSPQAAGHPADQ